MRSWAEESAGECGGERKGRGSGERGGEVDERGPVGFFLVDVVLGGGRRRGAEDGETGGGEEGGEVEQVCGGQGRA